MDLQYDGQQVEGHCLAHGHLAVAGYSMAVGKSSPNLTDSLSSSSMKPIESCERAGLTPGQLLREFNFLSFQKHFGKSSPN